MLLHVTSYESKLNTYSNLHEDRIFFVQKTNKNMLKISSADFPFLCYFSRRKKCHVSPYFDLIGNITNLNYKCSMLEHWVFAQNIEWREDSVLTSLGRNARTHEKIAFCDCQCHLHVPTQSQSEWLSKQK